MDLDFGVNGFRDVTASVEHSVERLRGLSQETLGTGEDGFIVANDLDQGIRVHDDEKKLLC